MKKMVIKPVKLICSIPGCKNVNTFNSTRNGEMRHSVNICFECIKELYSFIEPSGEMMTEGTEKAKSDKPPRKGKKTDDTKKDGDGE